MGRLVCLSVCLLFTVTAARASGVKAVDDQKINELELRAEHAQPQEQCYLYAQLVAQMSEVADHQLASGDEEKALQTLARMQQYTSRIHQTLGPRDKKLKESEILVRQTARRVDGMFHQAALEQQEMLRGALQRLNALQSEMMLAVFQH
jgi:hypothetical protein